MGPGDRSLPRSEIEGFQPISRIGEIVINAFVDPYEWNALEGRPDDQTQTPRFHEWATVQPGMVCVTKKQRSNWHANMNAQTCMPVIACAYKMKAEDEKNYQYAGVARTKSVRTADDGLGPTTDEPFTLAIGGMVTCLNNGTANIAAGDMVEWTFSVEQGSKRRRITTPRRIVLKTASALSTKIVGRALSFAKPGEPIDILLKQ
tara:strand:+ start:327 stop:938 length:612 start_codon:yes stop_codon:yes gene_type:complete